ncbi:6-phosphogluconolactonase [Zhouia sp. PK063]|uniref:6-phosphogluconolactonase n=1 Tax=Zhouia sp. PK063 TaxID=3373602 RepID=UPI00378945F4
MITVFKDKAVLNNEIASLFVDKANEAIQAKGKFTVALTGGSSPAGMYELLTTTYKTKVDWSKVFVFWCDERWVPLQDERSNAGNAFSDFLNKVSIPENQIYPMYEDGIGAEAYAEKYSKYLEEILEDGEVFDVIFLGMGDDGHTASLFPGEAVIDEKDKKVAAYFLAPQNMYRITLTAPLINKAKNVIFMAFGEKKAHALYEVLNGERNIKQYPAQIIQPGKGEAIWFVDEAAAKLLK